MLRAGFLEALGRRAAFTRRHRGPFAAPLDSDADDTRDTPAGYHAGDRVLFAWHRRDGSIGCATFDTAGRQVGDVHSFAGGRWPRITARERMSAIASVDAAVLSIRLHDGDRWQEPVTLTSPDGAIAFGPDGALTAATTDGVWRLAGRAFARIGSGSYAHPALAVAADGEPHVAYERGSEVWCGDERLGVGRRPTIVAALGGIHVAWISEDGVHLRQRADGAWKTHNTIPVRPPTAVALALEGDRVRLTCFGPVPYGPEALWLVRLPDPSPILMPSVAGNVIGAWLMHKFELRGPRSSYRPHDLEVAFNGATVQAFEKDVAEGRYLFRLDPRKVMTASGRAIANQVNVNSRHTNGGHYMINNDFDLIVQTAWSERWGFVASPAELLPETLPNVNEDRPDLVLLANTLRLPMEAPPAGPMTFDVLVMNIGEAPAAPCEIVLSAGKRELSRTAVQELKPGEDEAVSVPFSYDGVMDCVELRLAGTPGDFSPASNLLTVHLWVRREDEHEADASVPSSALAAAEPAADFTLPLHGGPGIFQLSDVAGDVVLVNWWRTSCPWSQREAPKLAALYQRYRHRGFEILGVSDDTADTVAEIERYRGQHGITWPLALNDQGEFLKTFVPTGQGDTPANYLITRSGRVLRLGLDRSDGDWARLEEAVRAAIEEPLPVRPAVARGSRPPAPPLDGTDLDGRTVRRQDFAGRSLVINFFNSSTADWAGGALADLHQRFGPQGLAVFGVNLFDDDTAARACAERHRITFPIVRGTPEMTRDWGLGSSAWGTFFILPDGRIFKSILNSIDRGIEAEVFRRYAEHLVRLK